MQVGIFCGFGEGTPPEHIAAVGQAIEERGFHAIWVPEHVVLFREYESTYPYSEDGRLPGFTRGILEPFVALSFLAAHTRRIRLGTSICLVPQRNPVYTAKQVADVDFLSGGRLDFGVGAGWLREEFEALQVPWERRGSRTADYIRAMQALWGNELAEYHGAFYDLPACLQFPKPVQRPHPPIFFGGESDPALRRVAALGQGWLGAGVAPEDVPEKRARLHRFLAEAGRRPEEVPIYMLPNRPLKARDLLTRYEDAGVSHVIHAAGGRSLDETRARLDAMAAVAAPHLG